LKSPAPAAALRTWWGRFDVPMNRSFGWRIGPLRLIVGRRPYEWQAWWWREADDDPGPTELARDLGDPTPAPGAQSVRSAFGRTVDPLHLVPALADRPVVVTPESSFQILPGEEVRAFVTVPLWVRALVGEPGLPVGEVPVQRPPDTWFGRDTMEGELCYAGRTSLGLQVEALRLPVQRAITPVRMRNQGKDPLVVHRVRLPVGQLSLHVDAAGQLWTPEVSLVREESDLARVRVGSAPPPEAVGTRPVAGPRLGSDDKSLVVAFSALLGGRVF
jgi:hypothetical protein